MKLLDFLPGIAQNTQVRFKEAIYRLELELSSMSVYNDTYLVVYYNDNVLKTYYYKTNNIKRVLRYVAKYGKDCQVMLLKADDNEPIVELMF